MPAVPVPVRASVRDLLRDLLGAEVSVRDGTLQQLDDASPAYLVTYRRDDDEPVAATVVSQGAAVAMGACIGMLSPAEAAEQLDERKVLTGDLEEFFHEVVNVFAKLLNSPTTRHVRLADVVPVPGSVPQDVAQVVLQPRVRVDWSVDVSGHPGGLLTLVAV